jgi:hypothetical protein
MPCFAAVGRAQNGSSRAYDPTLISRDKIDAEQIFSRFELNRCPNSAAGVGAKDRSPITDREPNLLAVEGN